MNTLFQKANSVPVKIMLFVVCAIVATLSSALAPHAYADEPTGNRGEAATMCLGAKADRSQYRIQAGSDARADGWFEALGWVEAVDRPAMCGELECMVGVFDWNGRIQALAWNCSMEPYSVGDTLETGGEWYAGLEASGRQCETRAFCRCWRFDSLDTMEGRVSCLARFGRMNALVANGEDDKRKSASDASGDEGGAKLDMLPATATNGNNGYLSRSAIDGAVYAMWSAVAKDGNQLRHIQAKALQDAAQDLFGCEALSEDAAMSFIREHANLRHKQRAWQTLRTSLSENIAAAIETGVIKRDELDLAISQELRDNHLEGPVFTEGLECFEISDEVAMLVYQKASHEHLGLKLPVYDSDGKTVVGEFVLTVM